MDTVEITISGKATVPAKYVPLIEAMLKSDDMVNAFQEMADEIIKFARITAAKAGCEVDDLIAEAVRDHEASKAA